MSHIFKPGNVIKHLHSNTLCVVTSCDDNQVNVVFFNSENCNGHFLLENHFEKIRCSCNYDFHNDFNSGEPYTGEYQKNCNQCHGLGSYEKNTGGWKNAPIIASTIQAYITKHVMGTIFPELSI